MHKAMQIFVHILAIQQILIQNALAHCGKRFAQMSLGGGDVLRAARLLSLLLSEDEEDKREGAGSLSFYLFSESLQ